MKHLKADFFESFKFQDIVRSLQSCAKVGAPCLMFVLFLFVLYTSFTENALLHAIICSPEHIWKKQICKTCSEEITGKLWEIRKLINIGRLDGHLQLRWCHSHAFLVGRMDLPLPPNTWQIADITKSVVPRSCPMPSSLKRYDASHDLEEAECVAYCGDTLGIGVTVKTSTS